MNKLFEILSNREIALLFWSMVLLGFIFSKKEVRESVLNVFKVLFTPTILIINLLLFDYVLLLIDLLQRAKFWEVALTKDTIIWTFGIAIILTYNAVTARKLEYFKRIVKDVVKWVVVLEFIINFYSFNILTEIIIVF